MKYGNGSSNDVNRARYHNDELQFTAPYAMLHALHLVTMQDAQAVAASLGKTVRFLDVDKTPERASVHPPLLEQVDSCGRRIETVRQPVVALLGHFNHGKTSILDALLGSDSSIAE